MRIYPAIDIKDGKCVRLVQGDFSKVTVFKNEPYLAACEWEARGASYIHIVDLDGAKNGSSFNNDKIKEIISHVKVPIQVGGGIRTLEDIDAKIAMGVGRVIIGTAAIKNFDIVKRAVEKYGDKIVVGVDAVNGKAAIEAWEEVSDKDAVQLCVDMKSIGVKTIVYTDISKDGMMLGPNVEATKEIVLATGINIIASGGVSTMKDLENLQEINVEGAIIGKALYENALDLEKVIGMFEK